MTENFYIGIGFVAGLLWGFLIGLRVVERRLQERKDLLKLCDQWKADFDNLRKASMICARENIELRERLNGKIQFTLSMLGASGENK